MNLNQVTVPALDIEITAAFYRDLGLLQIVSAPHYARFECPNGSATFSIHKVDHASAGSRVVVYFECEDLDAQVALLRQKGFEFSQMPTDETWLWREAHLSDPSGNALCLYWAGQNRKNPPWRIDAQQGAAADAQTLAGEHRRVGGSGVFPNYSPLLPDPNDPMSRLSGHYAGAMTT